MTVAGVLLAAGAGARFGRPKALVPFRGTPLVARGVALLADAGCAPVVAVVGADADAVARCVGPGAALVVVNPSWRDGMATSLQAALDALDATSASAAVVALADQPLVAPAAVRRLIDAWRGGAEAVVATYGGHRRNPVLLDRALWGEIAVAAAGDAGARTWLERHRDRVTPVPCDDVAAPDDIDTPTDLERLEQQVTPWS